MGLFRYGTRRQCSRSGYASTPAFGRAVRASGPVFTARLKPGSSVPCLNKLFAQFDLAPGAAGMG